MGACSRDLPSARKRIAMTYDIAAFDDHAVYRRTPKGQQKLFDGSRDLSRTERRLLGMVTAFTEVRVLLDLGLDLTEVRNAVSKLVRLGLIVSEQ